jgi:hypothetical protein
MFNVKQFRMSIAIFASALACITVGSGARAATPYDGDWTVLIATHSGACGQAYRYGVRISSGVVLYDGGMVTMRGSVTPKGAVKVMVRAGDQWANGSGRLNGNRGSGVWKGRGTDGACSGTWLAEKRYQASGVNSRPLVSGRRRAAMTTSP